MDDLTALKEKRKAYVKAEAQKIVNEMVRRGVTTDSLNTCDYPNWDRELHRSMLDIAKQLLEMGVSTSSVVRHGVSEWTFTVIV